MGHHLRKISTKAPDKVKKEKIKKETAELVAELGELQNKMFAEGKHSLLIILQGMDASGKDGVIRKVFEAVNPQGIKVVSFKKPTPEEMQHDFLWRVHAHAPARGTMCIFNRSHYEDVLIQKVHKWVDKDTILRRYTYINQFEALLTENDTSILKFYLHVSPEKQMERLTDRMNDDTKKWKHNDNDLKERELWSEYMEAYEGALNYCPGWNIIPADNSWYKEYLIVKKIVETLRSLKMRYPGFKV